MFDKLMIHLYAIVSVQGETVSGNWAGYGIKKSAKNMFFSHKMTTLLSRSH